MSQVIINQAGPLPITKTVKWPSDGSVLVAVSGSAWTQSAHTMLSVRLTIHATHIGDMQVFANAATTHLAFPTAFFPVTGTIGDATVTLTVGNGTTVTDLNDHFTVALIY